MKKKVLLILCDKARRAVAVEIPRQKCNKGVDLLLDSNIEFFDGDAM